MIESPAGFGPFLAPLCWRSVQVLPQQEFDQEGQLLTKLGSPSRQRPPGDVCGLPAQTFTFTDAGQRSGPPHAVTGVDVVAQFGDKTYLATVTVQTTATDSPNYVRDCHDNPQGIQVLPPTAGRAADVKQPRRRSPILRATSRLLIDRPQQPESQTPIGAGPPEPPLWCHAT